jgi:hypothetical protein
MKRDIYLAHEGGRGWLPLASRNDTLRVALRQVARLPRSGILARVPYAAKQGSPPPPGRIAEVPRPVARRDVRRTSEAVIEVTMD